MSGSELLERVHETVLGYLELGNRIEIREGLRVARNARCPDVYDANFASGVVARSADEIDALLADLERVFAGQKFRQFVLGPETPPGFEARLALLGYLDKPTLQLLLEGELRATPKAFEIRPVASDEDWASLAQLQRHDDLGGAAREQREPYPAEVSAQLSAARRGKAPELRFFLARPQRPGQGRGLVHAVRVSQARYCDSADRPRRGRRARARRRSGRDRGGPRRHAEGALRGPRLPAGLCVADAALDRFR